MRTRALCLIPILACLAVAYAQESHDHSASKKALEKDVDSLALQVLKACRGQGDAF
jgi:hypothetical protein